MGCEAAHKKLLTRILIKSMALSPKSWHQRFQQQARWTEQIRRYLFGKVSLSPTARVLEVGCGTGALLPEFGAQAATYGLDLNDEYLRLAQAHAPAARLVQGDGHRLPYAAGSFEVSLCHFLLLWVDQPVKVLAEMRRVTRPGGWVLALAEPDYGGRIDYPEPLADLGRKQADALEQQGADPHLGRKLADLFEQAGLDEVETGVLGGQWRQPQPPEAWRSEWETEWAVIEADLSGQLPDPLLEDLRRQDADARRRGVRILYVPTFYAAGRVPEIME